MFGLDPPHPSRKIRYLMLGSSRRPNRTYVPRALTFALAAAPFLAVPAYALNHVPNPGFESCVQGATPASWAPFGADEAKCDGTQANNGAFSLALSNPSGTIARAQSDCIVVPPGTSIQAFRFAYQTAASDVVQIAMIVQSYTGADCTGSSGSVATGAGFNFVTPISPDGDWHTLPYVTAPIDATIHTVRVTAGFQVNTAAATSIVHFDDLDFTGDPVTTTTLLTGSSSTTSTVVSVTSTTVPTPTILPPSFPGTGSVASECYVAFEGIGTGRPDCTDGDPACDADGAENGSCSFALRVCAAQALAGCQAATVTSLKVSPAKLAIPLPTVPASTPACGAPAQVVVPLRRNGRRPGKRSMVFVAKSDGKLKRERDVLRFRCLPPA
jgi:hypothetical protein